MVKLVRDQLHGFSERPHYEPRELDQIFERLVVDFLTQKYGVARFPIGTEDLKTLIERDVSDLEQYSDLSRFGAGVEGVTIFKRGAKPRVLVASELTEDDHRENRLRTTLTHEYGHVRLHTYMFDLETPRPLNLAPGQTATAIYCKRETMIETRRTDWREWQAGYACGATLMPRSHITRTVRAVQERFNIFGPVPVASPGGQALIAAVTSEYQVSPDAARVRLSVLGFIGHARAQASLFA